MLPDAAAIFLSAFLLFQVQPLAGKTILPWFGGSAAVWSACLLFFQGMLFFGYLYAHLLGSRLHPRRQAAAHALLLLASLAILPVAAPDGWEPAGQTPPVARILAFLAATVGLPYFLLSATSPLLQRWRCLRSAAAPWHLYALSNLGSLLGLLAYPFLVEPLLSLHDQRSVWSGLYIFFVIAVAASAAGLARSGSPAAPGAASGVAASPPGPRPPADRIALVLGLSMTGSLLMAATTHHLCQNVAVVPLLWILPLAIYLVSFVVVFAGDRFYRRELLLPLLAATTVVAVASLYLGFRVGLPLRIAILSLHLFVACLALHGEMARLKPDARHLTGYYLLLSAGGALGTAFVTFLAPVLFSGYWEYHVALAASWGLVLAAVFRHPATPSAQRPRWLGAAAALSLLALVAALRWHTLVAMAQTVRAERNFYGALQVVEREPGDPGRRRFELVNGGVVHGAQFTAAEARRRPTVYYGQTSGLGMALRAARTARAAAGEPQSLAIGCVGLGVGTVAAYTIPGDRLRAYELNPAVARVARENFTFLADAPATVEVAIGDARLTLERELATSGGRGFDVLVVDAFTGDAIPAHLLTREAFRLYLAHLAPRGRLLFHVSNRYLDLRPLVLGLAREAGRAAIAIDTLSTGTADFAATWVDVSPGPEAYSGEERAAAALSRPLPPGTPAIWTDEYSNLLGLLDRPGARELP